MSKAERPYAWTVEALRKANLRPTRQRMGLLMLLFSKGDRHVCAEQLYQESNKSSLNLSLATVYNTLNQFKEAGILSQISLAGGRVFFDTNTKPHHHIFYEASEEIEDIAQQHIMVQLLPDFPQYLKVSNVEVVVRVKE